MRQIRCAALFCLAATGVLAQAPSIDPHLAAKYFQQLRETSARDAGKLWGKPIYGPILLVDRKTRDVIANQADSPSSSNHSAAFS
jgi:hypothetical protein